MSARPEPPFAIVGVDMRTCAMPPVAAMVPLLEAYRSSKALRLDLWEFAVELRCLREAGLSHTHLRWRLANKLIAQGIDRSEPAESCRLLVPVANLSLSESACFVLTEAGAAYAAGVASDLPDDAAGPSWDAANRQLRFASFVVKRFRQPAPNQALILQAFEEEGWPPCIDDPLPPVHEQDSKRRLHTTINNLNRSHERRLIKFSGGGDGQSVAWRMLVGESRAKPQRV